MYTFSFTVCTERLNKHFFNAGRFFTSNFLPIINNKIKNVIKDRFTLQGFGQDLAGLEPPTGSRNKNLVLEKKTRNYTKTFIWHLFLVQKSLYLEYMQRQNVRIISAERGRIYSGKGLLSSIFVLMSTSYILVTDGIDFGLI